MYTYCLERKKHRRKRKSASLRTEWNGYVWMMERDEDFLKPRYGGDVWGV